MALEEISEGLEVHGTPNPFLEDLWFGSWAGFLKFGSPLLQVLDLRNAAGKMALGFHHGRVLAKISTLLKLPQIGAKFHEGIVQGLIAHLQLFVKVTVFVIVPALAALASSATRRLAVSITAIRRRRMPLSSHMLGA